MGPPEAGPAVAIRRASADQKRPRNRFRGRSSVSKSLFATLEQNFEL